MKFAEIIKFILKNILYLIAGAIAGLLILWLFLIGPLLTSALSGKNFAEVLVGAIIFPLFYSIFAMIIGAILGVIVYNIFRFVKKKKSKIK